MDTGVQMQRAVAARDYNRSCGREPSRLRSVLSSGCGAADVDAAARTSGPAGIGVQLQKLQQLQQRSVTAVHCEVTVQTSSLAEME